MDIKDFKFKITDKESGDSIILSFADLYGYEGEGSGILIDYKEHLKDFSGMTIVDNKYGPNEDLDIEYVSQLTSTATTYYFIQSRAEPGFETKIQFKSPCSGEWSGWHEAFSPTDGGWYYWKDKFGKVEKARLKMDAIDHFYPGTTFISSNIEDLEGFFMPEDEYYKAGGAKIV